MIEHIVALLRSRVHVAIVTAAGYPGHAERFEQRVEGLLAAFRNLRLPAEVTDRRAGALGAKKQCSFGSVPAVAAKCGCQKSLLTGSKLLLGTECCQRCSD